MTDIVSFQLSNKIRSTLIYSKKKLFKA